MAAPADLAVLMLLFLDRQIAPSIIKLHILIQAGGRFLVQHDHICLVPVQQIFLLHQFIGKKIYLMLILTLLGFLLQILFIRILFAVLLRIPEFLAEALELLRKSLGICPLIYSTETIYNL